MTTINVDEEIWKYLNSQRQDPSETLNDVLRRELFGDRTDWDDRLREALSDRDLSEDRQEAIAAMWTMIKTEEEVAPADLKSELYEKYPGGYGSGPDYWHRQLGDILETMPGIKRASQRRWVWSGD